MTADFTFLEYSFNSAVTDTTKLFSDLRNLGFTNRSAHVNGRVTVWNQNFAILIVRETDKVHSPGITGLGFLAPHDTISKLACKYDNDIDMWVTGDTCGMRIILIADSDSRTLDQGISENYNVIETGPVNNPGLLYFSGVVYNTSAPRMMDFFQDIGFKFTKSGENYNLLLSANNRFTIACNKHLNTPKITSVIMETNDVFATTSYLVAKSFELKHFDINPDELDFGKLNHKIVGYNCKAHGNKESYSIENFAPDVCENFDLIFRTRKQYLHVSEHTLSNYYDAEKSIS